MSADARLKELKIVLPEPPKPVAAYVPCVRSGATLYVAGQIPFVAGELKSKGKVGKDLTLEQAYDAARICTLNSLAIARAELGSLDKVKRVVRVAVFVAVAPGFTDVPKVANGASELLGTVFGDAGRHARVSVGVAELPLGSSVEVEVQYEVA